MTWHVLSIASKFYFFQSASSELKNLIFIQFLYHLSMLKYIAGSCDVKLDRNNIYREEHQWFIMWHRASDTVIQKGKLNI